jgi:hypothetical protein
MARAGTAPMRALLAVLALCGAVALARAGSISPAQVAELCANAEDTAHCGRLIEEKQLKRFAGLATRDGDDLRVSLYPRGEATFRDVVRVSGAESYTLWDVLSEINAVLVFHTDGDRTGYILLTRTNGRQYKLPAEPALSPDRQYLVTADFCADGCDNEAALWRVTRDDVRKERVFKPQAPWRDVTAEWSGPDAVVLDYRGDNGERQQVRLGQGDPLWRAAR